MRITLAIALALLTAGGFFYVSRSFSSGMSADLDYFKGDWTVTMKGNPKQSFNWKVKDDINGGWMVGVVERNGARISTDLWRQNGKKIERFAFTEDGTFVRIESSGWESGHLVLTGVASEKTGDTKIRETITRVNNRQFYALWEREDSNGRWVTFADEICTK